MSNIRALTVKQPWAGAIAHHGKAVENRSWHTRWRGTILIHAAKTRAHGISLILNDQVYSAIVAVATLTDCHPSDGRCTPWSDYPEPAGWHWVLTDVRTLTEPVACKGALGLWTPAPEVTEAVAVDLARSGLSLTGGAS